MKKERMSKLKKYNIDRKINNIIRRVNNNKNNRKIERL